MTTAVIAAYARSPFCPSYKGQLIRFRPDDILATVIKNMLERLDVDPETIEDLIVGCAFPEAEQGLNLARNAVFLSGLSVKTAGTTVNRYCGSSMQAIHMAAGAISMGAGDAFICGGVESMTRVPMWGFNPIFNQKLSDSMPEAYMNMGLTAEELAKKYGIDRKTQEDFAVESHFKAGKAQSEGKFDDEIVAIGNVANDGAIRPETDNDSLAGLKTVFDAKGTVTAGTSSPLTDGAAAVFVCSEDYAKTHGLPVLAKIKSIAVSGCAPEIMGIGPVEATRKALSRAGIGLGDIDIAELNEAFAVQVLSCLQDLDIPTEKINLDGGAIAIGHPLGATGARIVGKAASLLNREDKNIALACQCIGGGQGIATVLEAA